MEFRRVLFRSPTIKYLVKGSALSVQLPDDIFYKCVDVLEIGFVGFLNLLLVIFAFPAFVTVVVAAESIRCTQVLVDWA